VEAIVVDFVEDVHELDDIVLIDASGTSHFEVKVDAASFVSNSTLEESLFVLSNGLFVDIELDDLRNLLKLDFAFSKAKYCKI